MTKTQKSSSLRLAPFPATTFAEWKTQALQELGEVNLDKLYRKLPGGAIIAPVYIDRSELQNVYSRSEIHKFLQNRENSQPWAICQTIDCYESTQARESAVEDIQGGVDAVWIELNESLAAGFSACPSYRGVALQDQQALGELFAKINVDTTPLIFSVGCVALPFAALLTKVLAEQGKTLASLHGAVGSDPLASFARHGSLAISMEQSLADMAQLCRWSAENGSKLRTIIVSNVPYHEAGADIAWEIAINLATGIEYLRQLQKRGLNLQDLAKQMIFKLAVGRDFLLEVGKLRAMRGLWMKILAACGICENAEQSCFIHAQSSWRDLPSIEPSLNLIRTTLHGIAAVLGGADSISIAPYIERRYARNIQLLLRTEAQLNQVIDPVGGSLYIEELAEQLAQAAWGKFQRIEAQGGMLKGLYSGFIQSEVAKQAAENQNSERPVIGVNRFVREKPEQIQVFESNQPNLYVDKHLDSPINLPTYEQNNEYQRSYNTMVTAASNPNRTLLQLLQMAVDPTPSPVSIEPVRR